MPTTPLATLLKQLMDERRMSQRALSRRSAVPQSAISEILSGKRTNPRKATIDRLAVTFGVSPATLLAPDGGGLPRPQPGTTLRGYLDEIAPEDGEGASVHVPRTARILPCDAAGRPMYRSTASGGHPHAGGTPVDAVQLVIGPRALRGLLVVGAPGLGKTSLVTFVTATQARELRAEGQDTDGGGAPVPIPIELREFQTLLDEPMSTGEGTDERWITAYLTSRYGDAVAALLTRALVEGRAILLLDGYDEIEDVQARERVRRILGAALRRWPEARMLVTSRPSRCDELLGLRELVWAELEELSPPQMRGMLNKRATASGMPRYASPVDLLSPGARTALEESGMAGNPLVLSRLFDLVAARRRRLDHIGSLVAEMLRTYLAQHILPRSRDDAEGEIARENLEVLAMAMAFEGAGEDGVEFGWSIGALAEGGDEARRPPRRAARRFLERELDRGEILVPRPDGRLAFRYQPFRDYLAARALADLADDEAGGWWATVRRHLGDPGWQGILDHLAPLLLWTGRSRADRLFERLFGQVGDGDPRGAARLMGTAARLAGILRGEGYRPPRSEVRAAASEICMTLLETGGADALDEDTRGTLTDALYAIGAP